MFTSERIKTAWVTGAGGLIGSYTVRHLKELLPQANVMAITRQELDLTNFQAVREAYSHQRPQLIVHCAALTRTPDCEKDPALAHKLNVEVTAVLAELAAGGLFVAFSSDQVFDGLSGPYNESAHPNPSGAYGRTKVQAEQVVLANPSHLVIRTSLNGGTSPTGDRGFNEQMRHAWSEGRELTLFTDEYRCPIYAGITARAVCELALQGCSGIYHVGGTERLSRWEIGVMVGERWSQLKPRLRPASLADFKGPPRAPNLVLDCSKASRCLSFGLPRFSDWLREHPDEEF